MILSPLAQGGVEAEAEKLAKFDVRAEAAQAGDLAYGDFTAKEERLHFFEPYMEDFIEDRMAHGLAESALEVLARGRKSLCQGRGRKTMAGFAPNGFHCLQHEWVASAGTPRRFAAQNAEGPEGRDRAAAFSQGLCREIAGELEIQFHGRKPRPFAKSAKCPVIFRVRFAIHAEDDKLFWDMARNRQGRLGDDECRGVVDGENRAAPGERGEPL